MRAWVDESAREDGVALPMYLLGSSLTNVDAEQEASEMLQSLAPRGRKLHWRELGDRGRAEAADLLPALGIRHVVVIAAPLRPDVKQERARGDCRTDRGHLAEPRPADWCSPGQLPSCNYGSQYGRLINSSDGSVALAMPRTQHRLSIG